MSNEDDGYGSFQMDSLRDAVRLSKGFEEEYVELFDGGLWNEGSFERRRDVAHIPGVSEHCVLCFMTFASVERRIVWQGKHAHEKCVRRVFGSIAQ